MKRTWIYILAGIAVIVIVAALTQFSGRAGNRSQSVVYCNSDGTLTDTRPIQSHRSYCLQSLSLVSNLQPNAPIKYSFRIVDDQGNTLKDLDTVHEKIMHFIVVRKDLAEFQHVHPDFDEKTGMFTLSDLSFPTDGPYRLFADFTPSSSQMGADGMKLGVTSFQDVIVGDTTKYQQQPIGAENTTAQIGAYTITLKRPATIQAGSETPFTFSVKKDGKPVQNLEQYLGALAHGIILRQDSLDFIHAHAENGMTGMNPAMGSTQHDMNQMGEEGMAMNTGGPDIDFMTAFPSTGMYKFFLQFQHEGKVITADFVLNVVQGSSTSERSVPGMDVPGVSM